MEDSPALAGISNASIQGRIALGPRAGGGVWRVGADSRRALGASTVSRHAHLAGFDLHANVEVPAADRPRADLLIALPGRSLAARELEAEARLMHRAARTMGPRKLQTRG